MDYCRLDRNKRLHLSHCAGKDHGCLGVCSLWESISCSRFSLHVYLCILSRRGGSPSRQYVVSLGFGKRGGAESRFPPIPFSLHRLHSHITGFGGTTPYSQGSLCERQFQSWLVSFPGRIRRHCWNYGNFCCTVLFFTSETGRSLLLFPDRVSVYKG